MFGRPELKKLQKHIDKDSADSQYNKGMNRRAVSMVPGPALLNQQDLPASDQSKFRQLLLSIEANLSSCCIKVTSPKHKSRAAVLVFRGRVVGCIYGSKRLERQVFGQEAYSCILADVSHQTNTIDAYLLNEDLVLAAASLFNGDIFTSNATAGAEEVFESAHRGLIHSGMPGCIVIKTTDGAPAAIVYIFNGQIIGIYARKEGWVSSTYETALQYVKQTMGAKVSASMLAAHNIEEVNELSFSLSGLNDRKTGPRLSEFEMSYALVTNYDRKKALQMVTPFANNNPFMPNTKNPTLHRSRSVLNK